MAMEIAGGTLKKIVMDAVKRVPAEQAPIVAWAFACGTKVAEKTRPMEFKDGILRVEVPDFRWRSQLVDMSRQYLSMLREYSGQDVKRIEFVVKDTGVEQK
jgi:predicted nucleic acid-binding Zn ribbon protein